MDEPNEEVTLTDDPFFVIKGVKTHFWLPVATRTPLLRLDGPRGEAVSLLGQTFGDDRASQWFREYELKVDRKSKVRIEVGPPNADVPGALHTMQVWLNGARHVYTGGRGHGKQALLGHGISVTTRELPVKKILNQSAEEVTISSPMLNATIWSSAANKFYSKEKQFKFAHLNVDLNWLKGGAWGLLTELAGDRPMTRSSRLLLKSPTNTPSIGISGLAASEAFLLTPPHLAASEASLSEAKRLASAARRRA